MAQFGDPDVHFKWNNHQGDLVRKFHLLLEEERLVDVTLTVGGQSLKAHRLILAASSQYFEDLFSLPQSDDTSALAEINLSGHIQFEDLQVLVDYMYRGEISVPRDQLPSLLEAASQLKIRDNSIEHGQAQEYHDKLSDSINPLQLQLSDKFESIDSRLEVDAARFNQPETDLMDDGKGSYCNVTFVEPADQHHFTGLLETVSGEPLLPIPDDDSRSDTSADENIDPGWDDGVLPLTRAQFLEAKAEYLAKISHSVALKPNEAQEDSGQYEERMEESDVPENIEPNEMDHLSSQNDDDDANSLAIDSFDEEEKEEGDEEYEDVSPEKSQQSYPGNYSDDSTYDPGWDDGVLPLTRAQFLEAKAEYLAQKSRSLALKPNEAQEDSGQYEERMEESDVSEHIEPNEMDHLFSRDNDDGDANSSVADSYDEEEKEEGDEEYENASAEKSQQSSRESGSDDSSYGENSFMNDSQPSYESSDEDFNSNSSAAGPTKRKRSAKPSSNPNNRHLKKEGPVECINCGKLFQKNGAACKRHTEVCGFAETRKFPCQVCEKKYSRKYHLQRHLIQVHCIEPSQLANYGAGNRIKAANPDSSAHSSNSSLSFACKRCGLSYKSEESLRRHLECECINEGPSYHCSQCDYWSKRLDNLNDHVKIQHEEYGSILSL